MGLEWMNENKSQTKGNHNIYNYMKGEKACLFVWVVSDLGSETKGSVNQLVMDMEMSTFNKTNLNPTQPRYRPHLVVGLVLLFSRL